MWYIYVTYIYYIEIAYIYLCAYMHILFGITYSYSTKYHWQANKCERADMIRIKIIGNIAISSHWRNI